MALADLDEMYLEVAFSEFTRGKRSLYPEEKYGENGIEARVIDMYTLKPANKIANERAALETSAFATWDSKLLCRI